jgi:hypothetical protein
MTLGERLERAIKVLIAMQGLDNTLYSLRTAIDESSFSDVGEKMTISDLIRVLEDEITYCVDSAVFGA